jgi:hypothetical protein
MNLKTCSFSLKIEKYFNAKGKENGLEIKKEKRKKSQNTVSKRSIQHSEKNRIKRMETLKHGTYLCLVINGQVEMFSPTSVLV